MVRSAPHCIGPEAKTRREEKWFLLGEGIVAAERHYDSMRAQLTAAAGVGGTTALVSWGVAPLLGLQAPALLSAESAFWSFLIAASAGAVLTLIV